MSQRFAWRGSTEAAIVVILLTGQLRMMQRFLAARTERAIWYSGFGVPLYVLGMLASTVAVRVVIG